jgi:5-methylcytosine-specific restriction endonuclease McrA
MKVCNHCGIDKSLDEFYFSDTTGQYLPRCKACGKEIAHRSYLKHKSKRNAHNRAYAQSHHKEYAGYARTRRAKYPEAVRECRIRSYHKNYAKNQARHIKSAVEWVKKNPEKHANYNRACKAKRRASEGTYTAQEWENLLSQYGNKCLCCGRDDVKLEADHVIPVSRGGTSWISNIQPLCRHCNLSKGTKTTDYRLKPQESYRNDTTAYFIGS